jgi:hypothetical protein
MDRLDEVLGELGKQHRDLRAPAHLLGRLRTATRVKEPSRLSGGWAWSLAAVLVIAVAVLRTNPSAAPAQVSDQPGDQVTEFVALPGSQALPPPMETTVLRMQLRKGELREYGFEIEPPLASEFVQADFIVGDDGLARAVRFVR